MIVAVPLEALSAQAVLGLAVFARVGAMMMTAPAFGDFSLAPRFRLAAALAVTAALYGVAAPLFRAPASGDVGALAALLISETFIGLLLGGAARIFVSALNVAGQIIAFQMGLSLAQIFDPTQELQGAIVGGFLAVLGTTMIFATDAHHLLLAALRDSYVLMAPGAGLPVGDVSALMTDALSSAFSLGLRLAAPFVLFGLVFYVGAGVLNRLMPQAQVFFMLMPANLALGLLVLMLTISMIMTMFLGEFEAFLVRFLA